MNRSWRMPAAILAALTLLSASGAIALAGSSSTELPATWHIHDGQGATLGPQHKGIGFFPTILGISTAQYLEDPARCPNATDKAFLPSFGSSESPFLRHGTCTTDAFTIELQTVPDGFGGPDGWSSLTVASEPGWRTYYQVTPN
jgi:hypothetical protein